MRIHASNDILFIGHSYHGVTRSSDFFKRVLWEIGNVSELHEDPSTGTLKRDYRTLVEGANYDLVIVWQIEAIAKQLAGLSNVVFVPMYDGCRQLPLEFWRDLCGMRVLAFSLPVYDVAQAGGCDAQYCQYWPAPAVEAPIRKSPGQGFYWYRRDEVDLSTLSRICSSYGIETLRVLYKPDPNVPSPVPKALFARALPVPVDWVRWEPSRIAQLQNVAKAEYYVASRSFEGIGLSFLDAMAVECCVIAPANPTYTDYIVSGITGYLFDQSTGILPERRDLQDVRGAARRSVVAGRSRWLSGRSRLVKWLQDATPFEFFEVELKAEGKEGKVSSDGDLPSVSVVTVVRNAADALKVTIDNVLGQQGIDFEYIVLDGASTDATLDVANSYPGIRVHSEADRGVYDAMNKAADLATGKYIIFMNAGDRFVSQDSLKLLMSGVPVDADFVIGHHIYCATNGIKSHCRVADFRETYDALHEGRMSGRWHGGIPCHQATATRTALLQQLQYDTRFDIAADHDLLFRAAAQGATFHVSDVYVSYYEGGGFSARRVNDCFQQWIAIGLKHCKRPEAVRQFYMPEVVQLVRARIGNRRNLRDLASFVMHDWNVLYQVASYLSFRRTAAAVLRRLRTRARRALQLG